MSMSESVWDRMEESHERETLSQRVFIAAVTMFTCYGVAAATMIGYTTMQWESGVWAFLIVGLIIPFVGIRVATSENWFVSFIGYNMVVLGLGAITGPVTALYETSIVINAMVATGGVTVAMSLIGILYPKSLEHWGGYLFGALLALLFVRIGQVVFLSFGYPATSGMMVIIEYAAALLFSLYIIYDWNRALRLTYTLDNAVDCAMAIFLDIINLFLSLLRIMGSRSDD